MSRKKFHLAWFASFVVDEWNEPFSSAGGNPWTGDFYIEFARALERACFDYIILEDTLMVPESDGRQREGAADGRDPGAQARSCAARRGDRIPHVAPGRGRDDVDPGLSPLSAGARGGDHRSSRARALRLEHRHQRRKTPRRSNFGLDKLPPHDLRYEMADEYMDVVNQLFASWDPDAVVMDRKTADLCGLDEGSADPFRRQVFQVAGPLNTAPSPQGRPTYVQAGHRRGGATSPPSTPIRSSPRPTAPRP